MVPPPSLRSLSKFLDAKCVAARRRDPILNWKSDVGGTMTARERWLHACRRRLVCTGEETRSAEPFGAGGEFAGGSAPLQFVDVRKEWRIGSKCREILEQQREFAALA